MSTTIERDTLYKAIDKLPESTLVELARFIEFLQFKYQPDEQISETWQSPGNKITEEEKPPFNPVYFPKGILKDVDFSPEDIAEARKELWAGFGEDFE